MQLTLLPQQQHRYPKQLRAPEIPSEKGYLVQEIGNQLYSVSDGSCYNAMFMVTDQGVIAIDALQP